MSSAFIDVMPGAKPATNSGIATPHGLAARAASGGADPEWRSFEEALKLQQAVVARSENSFDPAEPDPVADTSQILAQRRFQSGGHVSCQSEMSLGSAVMQSAGVVAEAVSAQGTVMPQEAAALVLTPPDMAQALSRRI